MPIGMKERVEMIRVVLLLAVFVAFAVVSVALVEAAPRYSIVKAKVPRLDDLAPTYQRLQSRFVDATADSRDGLRLTWPGRWVHLRPSGTEPVIRIIAEAATVEDAQALVSECKDVLDA